MVTLKEPPIHIIGLTQIDDLVGNALRALKNGSMVIGSERQLEIVKPHLSSVTNFHVLPKLVDLTALINDLSLSFSNEQSIVVLASGDPLYYGIGRWFTKHFSVERLVFYPAVSSIQMACHRLALSLQDVSVHSVHGRPLVTLRTKFKNGATLVLLTDKNSNPQALANECIATGFAESTVTVLENLSYPHERIREFNVKQLIDAPTLDFDPLHVSVINVKATKAINEKTDKIKTNFLPQFPGIPDTAYITGDNNAGARTGKGMITKREVRLCVLSLMQPSNDDIIWDVGAGCGGVAVELSFWNERVQVYAIECHQERLGYLKENRQRFGVVQNLHVIDGKAPECLPQLPLPNKVFIGGSGGNMPKLLETIWQLLPVGGRLVASAVVSNTKQALRDFAEQLSPCEMSEVDVVEVAVKRGQFINAELDYTAKLPIEVFTFTKRDSS